MNSDVRSGAAAYSDRAAVGTWAVLVLITIGSASFGVEAGRSAYGPALVLTAAALKFLLIGRNLMNIKWSASWLRAFFGVYTVMLWLGLLVPRLI